MNLVNQLFQFLVSLALLSTVVLALGELILRFLKQPIERVRCIQFTLAALFFTLVVHQTAFLPKLSLPVLPAGTEVASLPVSEDRLSPSTSHLANTENSVQSLGSERSEMASSPGETSVANVPTVTFLDPTTPSTAHEATKPSSVPQSGSASLWSIATIVLTGVYLAVSACFSLLLLAGFYRLFMLRKHSQPIAPSTLKHWQYADAIGKRKVNVIASDEISVPIAFGVLSPTIAIPRSMVNEAPTDSLFYCLSHEWAHVGSHDVTSWWFVQILQPLLWFQPLYWRLQHELRMAQDQLADNFAAGSEDRTTYAQLLTDMAYAQQGMPLRLAVSMAGKRSNLYRRVECLLMSKFTLASRSRRWVAASMAGCLLIVAAILGVARLSPVAHAGDEQGSSANSLSSSTDESNDGSRPTDELKYTSFSGRVTDEDGQPITGATLWATRNFSGREGIVKQKVGSTNSEGAFHFEIDPFWLDAFRLESDNATFSYARLLSVLSIVAQSKEHGLAGLPIMVFSDDVPLSENEGLRNQVNEALGEGVFKQRTIRVPELSNDVKGRVVDLQGDPIPNVLITLESIESPNINKLLTALEEENLDSVNAARHERWFVYNADVAAHLLAESQPKIKSNSRGEFEIRGLGKDQLAILTLASEQHESARLHVLGREMEPERVPHVSFYPKGAKDVYYGTSFGHVLGPSIPVTGVVTEYQSGKLIAGAEIYVERLFEGADMAENNRLRLRTQYIRTMTDEQGRYTLRGLPPGGEHVIEVVPPKTEPWLIAKNSLSLAVDEDEHKLDVQVFRGIWIEGTLTDAKTNEPLQGNVDYLALRVNPNIPQTFGLRDGWEMGRFPVDASGRFRVVGLPGPGVLLARAYGKKRYPLAVGGEEIEGYDPDNKYIPTTPRGMPLSNWNRVQQVDPPKNAQSFSYDLTLTAGGSVIGRVEGPRELKKFELEVMGLNNDQFWSELKDSNFTVRNYEAHEPRRLFVRTKDRSLVGTVLVEGESPANLVVQLQPSVTITGRLIETATDEAAVGYRIHCRESSQGYFRIESNSGSIPTDEEGRFEINGLLAGIEYSMASANIQRFSSGKNDFKVDLTEVKPGSKIELGEVTGKNAN